MMRKITKNLGKFTAITAFLGLGLQANAQMLGDKLLFAAKMTGAQETPSVTTNAMGAASFTLNKTRDTMCVLISVNGLSGPITGAHVHTGAVGVGGGVITSLPESSTSNQITAMLTGTDVSPANIQKYLSGLMYVNVHTAANPNGEIRGQIYLETDNSYVANATGAQETPSVTTTAYGLGVFNLAQHDSVLMYHIIAQGLSGAITGAHLHVGAIGVGGGVVYDMSSNVTGNTISGTITTGVGAFLANLKSGNIYFNIHTAANPNGEIRGQLWKDNSLYFDANMNGPQDGTSAMGTGVVSMKLNTTFDTLSYNVVADNLTGAIGGMHIHTGAFGANGGVLVTLNSSPTSNQATGVVTGASLTPALINGLINGTTYVNIHTAANPNGEIRGQVYRLARQGYTFNMNGAQQFPNQVNTMAYGSGIASVDRNGTNAHVMVVVGGLSGAEGGVHIHKGAPNQAGGVLYNLSTWFAGTGTNDAGDGYLKSSDASPFTMQAAMSMFNDSTYINLHTAANPNGEIRGNVINGSSCFSTLATSAAMFVPRLDNKLLFSAKMTGAQETPSVTTNALGVASFTLNKTRDTMCVLISVNGLSGAITGAHVHTGAVGVGGGVVTPLIVSGTSNQIAATLTGTDVSAANIQKYLNGLMYVNVHTAANPNGEIRGQIYLETDNSYVANATGAQETPSVTTTAYGLGVFNLAQHDSVINYHVIAQGLSGAITGAHLHVGAVGVGGGVVYDMSSNVQGNTISGSITTGVGAFLTSLKAGNIYFNIHTAANPNGEIRGQLWKDNSLYFDANMDGAQDGTVATATGLVSMKLNTTFDTLSYNVVADGLTGTIGGMHIHTGAYGANGGVLVTLNSSPTSNQATGVVTGASLTPALINGLINGSTYVNIHTANYANGEIRGQVYRLARQGYNFDMNGAQQMPTPVVTNAYGSGIASVDRNSTNAHVMVVVGSLSGAEGGVHIHQGAANQAGGVLYNLSTWFAGTGTNDAGFGYLKNTDASPFTMQTGVSMFNDSTYINLHTAAHPNGEIRGNIVHGAACFNLTTGIKQNNATANGTFEMYPNPSSDMITIQVAANTSLNETTSIQVYNIVGQKVMEQTITGTNTCQLNINALNSGMYIVRVNNGTQQMMKQLIKN